MYLGYFEVSASGSTHQTLKLFSQVLRDNPCTREIGVGFCPEKLDIERRTKTGLFYES